MDIALSFWTKTTALVNRKKIYSIDKVKSELLSGNDKLSERLDNIRKICTVL